jgi:hypothetical protein
VTCDNASNNETFLRALANICKSEGINFDAKKNHVRCVAHVINLAVQAILIEMKAGVPQDEKELLGEIEGDRDIVPSGEVTTKVCPLLALQYRASNKKKKKLY